MCVCVCVCVCVFNILVKSTGWNYDEYSNYNPPVDVKIFSSPLSLAVEFA